MSLSVQGRDITKQYQTSEGSLLVLDGLSITVPSDQLVAIVGPSGCGKTTLMNILSGLDTEFGGSVDYSDQDTEVTKQYSAVEQQISYVFQEPRLLPWLTVEQNLTVILRSSGMSRSASSTRAQGLLEEVGLSGFEDSFPNQLSGGMRQRVGLARALSVEPDLIFMDEPFGSLDELTARELRSQLLTLHQEFNLTVVFITHDVTEAAYLADRVAVMSDRPGSILDTIEIELPRPREYDSPEVAKKAKQIVSHLV